MLKQPSSKNRNTYLLLCVLFGVVFVGLAGRLFYLQIVRHEKYETLATDQQTWEISVPARRGSIKDVNGVGLAVSATAYQVLMAPAQVDEEDREDLATFLAQTLDLDYDTVYGQTGKKLQYLSVKRRVEKDVADKVTEFLSVKENKKRYSGALWISEDTKRYYPYKSLLSTVIGFVGSDNQGLEGLEYYYDSILSGTPGKIIAVRTASGAAMPFEYESYTDPLDGYDLYLTVNTQLQYILEKHISNARVEHNVQSRIAGIIMNVKTGAVLGMTSKPDYDLNDPFVIEDEMTLLKLAEEYTVSTPEYNSAYNAYQAEYRKNKLVTELYDPGSTFKIFTSAMALEEKVIDLDHTFYCESEINMGAITYHCASSKAHGPETFRDAVANSCNVVFVQIADKIGIERFCNYFTLFGFREKTGVGLPGEVSGIFFDMASMNKYNLYSASFGQTFQITPMQLVTGVCAIANGGTYMRPYIVDRIVDSDGNVITQNEPTPVRQIVSASTCATLNDFLENAVVKGKTGYLKGYRICGKTGTSQKADSTGYESGKIIASFVCFAPADDPEIAVLVVVDEPNSTVQYGSYIAAPLGRDIMADCLEYLNIEPNYEDGSSATKVTVPDLSKLTPDEAAAKIEGLGLIAKTVGSGSKVLSQLPAAGVTLYSGNTVLIYTDTETDFEQNRETTVPDLIGKTAAECNSLLQQAGLNIRVVGENLNYATTVACEQSVRSGAKVDRGTLVTVKFRAEG